MPDTTDTTLHHGSKVSAPVNSNHSINSSCISKAPIIESLANSPLANASAGLDACVHCGFCLQACPTYVNHQDENDSPRGRIVLMRRMLEGGIALDDEVVRHIDRCLGCRGCETACPSGVPYGELLEATRATIAPVRGVPFIAKLFLLVFKHPLLMRPALLSARWFRATGIPRVLATILPRRLAFPLAMLASTAPSPVIKQLRRARGTSVNSSDNSSNSSPSNASDSSLAATHAPARTAVLEGCVMQGLFNHVNNDTKAVLEHNGHVLCSARGQRCCGALHAHAGDLEGARHLAKANIEAFEDSHATTIAVNAAGCAAMLKQYAHLLYDDPEWSARAANISGRTKDISEVLFEAGPKPGTLPGTVRVTHDPPCHQMHAQRIIDQPIAVLNSIAGVELVPLRDNDQCCGAAGIYNLIEPDTSDIVLKAKLECINETSAQLLTSGNPGCLMQMGAGLMLSGSNTTVVHPVELLAAGYQSQQE